jgi:hypothetical protein
MTSTAVTKNIKNMYSSSDLELFGQAREKEINLLFRAKE